jgi:hypothetical protein
MSGEAAGDHPSDGAMASVEYRVAHGDGAAVDSAWEGGVELESSAAGRPLTFEVGSRMVLPVIDHAVRRLVVGNETGRVLHSTPEYQLLKAREACSLTAGQAASARQPQGVAPLSRRERHTHTPVQVRRG